MTVHIARSKALVTRGWPITLFVVSGSALYLLGNNWTTMFPTQTSTVYKAGLALAFLVVALLLPRSRPWHAYWPVAYALFVGAAANLVQWASGNWLRPLVSAENSVAQDLAIDKVAQCIPVVLTILTLTVLVGDDLKSIFLQKGQGRAWLKFGLISFTVCVVLFAIIAVAQTSGAQAQGLMSGGLSLTAIREALPWILVFVFANAFMEELWFRGIYLNKLKPLIGPVMAILATSAVFGMAHISASYISPVEMIVFPIAVFTVGIVNGMVMVRTGSLWDSVLFHAGYDLLIIIPVMVSG